MKIVPCILSLCLPLAFLAITACAPQVPRGIMTYQSTEVIGRPSFETDGSAITMQIVGVDRTKGETIFWNDRVLRHQRLNPSRRYRFELLEGTAVSTHGIEYKSTDVSRVYDDQRLIYDASICRVHGAIMPRTHRHGGIDAESLPRGFDSAKARAFPNSKIDHDACYGLSAYSSLDWTCSQCSEAETKWLEKNPKPRYQLNPPRSNDSFRSE